MTDRAVVGLALIALPVVFNVVFADLARTFDYPDILRHEPGEILARFRAGGTALVVRWWAFVLVGVAFIPIGAVRQSSPRARPPLSWPPRWPSRPASCR